jgi:AraC family transcriptional regulator of adaptative response/methylated-DNA-[protein]-cysteine methyltransferase
MRRIMKNEISVYFKNCSLGRVLVAETSQGICSILLGDKGDDENLLAELHRIFPQDTISLKVGASSNDVVDVIDTGVRNSNLVLDIRTGTDLQQLVWLTIMKIQAGETMTYAEVADKIGRPKAWRAVASACSHNIIAYIIPCHRVVSKLGDKYSYRWGSDRKKKLLDRESGKICN